MLQSWLGAIFHVDEATCGANLVVTEYHLGGSREKYWKKSREFSCFKDTQNPWKTLAFEVIISHQTGLPGLCVLLCNSDKISGDVTIAVSMVNENICSHANIPAAMVPSSGVYHLTDGPSVLWCNGSQLAMLSVSADNVIMSLHCFSIDQLFNNTSIHLNWTLSKLWVLGGQEPGEDLKVFIRATTNTTVLLQDTNPPKKLKMTDTNVLLSTVTITQATPTVTKLQDSSLVIHSDYASVISCVTEFERLDDPDLLSDQSRSLRYIVGTTYQQILMFGGGKVLHCASIECVPNRIAICQVCSSVASMIVM